MLKVATRTELQPDRARRREAASIAPAPAPAAPPPVATLKPPAIDEEARQLIRALSRNVDRVASLMADQIQSIPAAPAVAEPAPAPEIAMPAPPRRARALEMPPIQTLQPDARPPLALVVEQNSEYRATIGRDKKGRMSTVTIASGGSAKQLTATVHRDTSGKMDGLTIAVSRGNS